VPDITPSLGSITKVILVFDISKSKAIPVKGREGP
jgi:hypothetical protein